VLDDGEVDCTLTCEIDKILAHRDTKTGHRSYYVQWKGLPPEENECLTASKLKNATDVVQDYLDELSNRGRQAARVGRPGSAAAQGDSTVSDSGNTDSQDAVVAKPKRGRGRPRMAGITKPAQKRGRGRPRKQQWCCAVYAVSSVWRWPQLVCLIVCEVVCVHVFFDRG